MESESIPQEVVSGKGKHTAGGSEWAARTDTQRTTFIISRVNRVIRVAKVIRVNRVIRVAKVIRVMRVIKGY